MSHIAKAKKIARQGLIETHGATADTTEAGNTFPTYFRTVPNLVGTILYQ